MREFNSFRAFGAHLGRLALEGEHVTHELAKQGGELIQRDAKEKFGDYQGSAGPFNAWSELADSTKDDRVRKGFPENEPLLRTGQLREEIELHVHGSEAVVASMDPIMLWQEQGTEDGHIPPRPVLGPAAYQAKPKLQFLCSNMLIAWLTGAGWRRPRRILGGPTSRE